MSGGTYGYVHAKIAEMAESIPERGHCSAASPVLRRAFAAHLAKVAEACRAIEWNDSGDGDDEETENILAVLPAGAELRQAVESAVEAKKMLEDAIGRAEHSKGKT